MKRIVYAVDDIVREGRQVFKGGRVVASERRPVFSPIPSLTPP